MPLKPISHKSSVKKIKERKKVISISDKRKAPKTKYKYGKKH